MARDGKISRNHFPLLGYSLQLTREVSGVCFPSATSWTPLHRSEWPQRSSRGRFSPAKAVGGASIQDPHRLLREEGSSHPPRPAIAAAPLSSTLGGGPRPSREAPPPGGRPGRCPPSPPVVVSKSKAPNGDAVLVPPAPQPVRPSQNGQQLLLGHPECVRVGAGRGERGAGRARPREGLAARAPGLTARAEREQLHTHPLASLLTPPLPLPSPPTPPPRPSPSSLIGQRDKSFCGDGWALTSRAELSHLGIPGAVRMLPAAGSRRRGQQRAGPQPGGGEEHSASRWGDDSGRVSMEIPLGLA